MAVKLYEIRVLKQGQPVRDVEPFLAELNLDAKDALPAALNRHLYGAVGRANAAIADAHLFSLAVHEIDRDSKGYGRPVITWALPVADGSSW